MLFRSKVKEAMVEFSPVFLFLVFHICAMLTEWRLNHLGRKKLRSTEIDKELRYLHLCSGSLSHFCVARLYHCCVVYIYHLCVVFLHHPCGSSPPLVGGFSHPTLFVGHFHLNQNLPIIFPQIFAFIPINLYPNCKSLLREETITVSQWVWLVASVFCLL